MEAPQTADLLGLGQHCSVPDCSQLDFLPFVCDCCSKVFCLDHRTYAAHTCPASGAKQLEVVVCPLCAQGVRVRKGTDPNEAFNAHINTPGACDPANYGRVHNKPRCPVRGCKEKLTTINTYRCKVCEQKVCLQHRMVEDHRCPGPAAGRVSLLNRLQSGSGAARAGAAPPNAGAKPGLLASWGAGASSAARELRDAARQAAAASRAAVAQAGYADPANSVAGTAERRRQQGLPEVCPQCGARFASVAQLVAHAESAHLGAGAAAAAAPPARGSGGGGAYRCARCGVGFAEPVQLLAHDKRCREGASCAVS